MLFVGGFALALLACCDLLLGYVFIFWQFRFAYLLPQKANVGFVLVRVWTWGFERGDVIAIMLPLILTWCGIESTPRSHCEGHKSPEFLTHEN